MSQPKLDQECEICGAKNLEFIIDGAVKRMRSWAKGHFIYMCPSCHQTNGLGTDPEICTVYRRFIGSYFEIKEKIMSTESITKCDLEGCSVQKREVNHWWKVWIDDGVFGSAPLNKTVDLGGLSTKDACGMDHAIVFYKRFLDHGTFQRVLNVPEIEKEFENI